MKPETEATSGVFNGVAVSNARFKLKYDDPTAYGFEIGGSDFAGTPLRAGLFFVTAKPIFAKRQARERLRRDHAYGIFRKPSLPQSCDRWDWILITG